MRLYYIFFIRDDIYKITKDNPERLYCVLRSIYEMNEKDIKLGYRVFESTCKFLDKKKINTLLKNLNYDKDVYTCYRYSHMINDFLNDETTKLTIKNSHIYLKTNKIYPLFLKQISNVKNLFVCDFINEDYFYLNKIKVSVNN